MRIVSIDHPNRGSRSMLAVQPHAHDPSHSTHHTAERPPAIETVEIDSIRLPQGQRELLIRHGNECYRLRHTRNANPTLTNLSTPVLGVARPAPSASPPEP